MSLSYGRLRGGLVGFLLFSVAGCQFETLGSTGGLPAEPIQPSGAPLIKTRIDLKVSRIAPTCVLSGSVGGSLRSVVLSEHDLTGLLDDPARWAADSSAPALTFETYPIHGGEDGALLLGCIVPHGGRGVEHRASLVAASRRIDGAALRTRLFAGRADAGQDPSRNAWNRLIRELLPTASQNESQATGGPLASPGTEGYVPAGTPPVAFIPDIEVWGTPTQWIVNVTPLYDAVRRHWSLSDLINWEWHLDNGPNCAHASDLWQIQDEEAQRLEDNVDFLDLLTSELGAILCDTTVSQLPWCVDLFIQASRAFVFAGDDRDFDPDAGWRKSRVQFYFHMDSTPPRWEVRISESRLFFGPTVDVGFEHWTNFSSARPNELFDPAQDVVYTVEGDSVRIKMAFRNTYCLSRIGCPAIDVFLWFVPDSSKTGGWAAYWKRDGFPSMQINFKNANGAWAENARDSENPVGARALIGTLRQHNTLPWPCEHQ